MANRYPLRIKVTNQFVTYDYKKDKLYYRNDISISTYVNRGYMAYDMLGNNIGIVFFSDNKNTKRYSNSEILFLASLKTEYGTWRTIKRNGEYFWFSQLEKVLTLQSEYEFTVD